MSRLDNYYESINALAARQPEQFIHASEERYRNIIRRVAEQAVSSGSASIILLAGPSASGKTTTAGKIASVTAKLCVVRERYMETSAVPTPSSSDTAVQMRNETSVNSLPKIELSTEGILL